MLSDSPTSPATPDELRVVVQLAWIAFWGLCVTAVVFTTLGSIAFFRTQKGAARSFTHLFERAEAVKLSAVILIVVAVTVLGLLGKISSQGVVGVLGGIAGYVLGGLQKPQASGSAKEDSTETQ
jgi:hypothetical protein